MNPALPRPRCRPPRDPAERLWCAEAASRLYAALGGLSPDERWVPGLACFRDLSHAEIAAATALPPGTVESHALRARNEPRAAFAT